MSSSASSSASSLRVLIGGPAVCLAAVLSAPLVGQSDPPGQRHWGTGRFIEYVVGNAPLVISMPHGGYLKPPALRNRTSGVTTQDGRTQETGREIARKFRTRFGLHPHLIINQLHRVKLDANRDIVAAAQGDKFAERAWREFHGFIDTARRAVVREYGKGLYIDLHGHGHPIDWVELGYLLRSSELNLPNTQLNRGTTYIDRSSIRHLATVNAPVPFSEILRGPSSLGGRLEARGLLVVPGPRFPGPGTSSYFRGGYNTARWGARGGGTIDGIQIELPSSMRRNLLGRGRFTTGLIESFEPFFNRFYGIDLRAGPRLTATASTPVGSERGEIAEFTVARTGPTTLALVVPVRWSGTARSGQDYRAIPSTVTIPAGRATARIPVRPLQDGLVEGQETVVLHLLPATTPGYPRIGATPTATVILLDDERESHRLSHWYLDDGAGTTARDQTIANRHGRLQPTSGGPTWIKGQLSGGLSFDERDDRVVIPDFDYAGGGDFSLVFWFRVPRSSQSTTQYMFSHGRVSGANSLNVYFFENTGLLRTWLRCKTELTNSIILDVATNFMDDSWHSYVLTVERGFGFASVYIDGALQQRNLLAGDDLDPLGSIYLGARQDRSSSRFLGGGLDDVQIWDRELAAAEVRELHAASLGYTRRFGAGCPTSGNLRPIHSVKGNPGPGRIVAYEVINASPATAAMLFFGFSRSVFRGTPLPLDLGLLGAPGCQLYQDALLVTSMALFRGQGAVSFGLPPTPSLRGLRAYSQVMVLDSSANRAGLAVSNGVTSAVGG